MIRTSKYWVGLLLPLVILLGGGLLFSDFILHAVSRNPTLNLSILAAVAVGIGVCLQRMIALQAEAKVFQDFKAAYDKGSDPHVAAEEIADSETHMAELLTVVGSFRGQLTNRLEQVSLLRAFESIKDAYGQSLTLPNFLSGFMIALGLFGTFIGLLETLQNTATFITSITSSSDAANADSAVLSLIQGIQGPLSGMGTSFSASLFGLLGSIIVSLMVSSLSAFIHRIELSTRRLVDVIVEVEVQATQPETLSPEQIMQVVSQLVKHEQTASELFIRSRQADLETNEKLSSVASQMATSMNSMTTLSQQFTQQAQALVASVQSQVVSQQSLERIQESLQSGVVPALRGLHELVQQDGKERRMQDAQRQAQDVRGREQIENLLANLGGRISEIAAVQAAHADEANTMVRAAKMSADSVSRLSSAIVAFQSGFEALLGEVSSQIADASKDVRDAGFDRRG